MSQTRRVIPGQIHMISRRCLLRMFLLRPCKIVKQVVSYALAVAAKRHHIRLHAFAVESNHYHLVLTDPHGLLPDFEHDFDQLVARALNSVYGRGEALWAPGSYSNVELHNRNAILRKLIYVMLNPVKDGLVARPEQWPGLITLPEDIGTRVIDVEKPDLAFFGGRRPKGWQPVYRDGKRRAAHERLRRVDPLQEAAKKRARDRSTLPKRATLELTVPAGFEDMSVEAFQAQLRKRLEAAIETVYAERKAAGRTTFMGAHAVRTQSPFESAGDTFPTFERDPRISCPGDAPHRIRVIAGLKAWREDYRLAREAWLSGNRSVRFPWGTYGMRVIHRASVRGSPSVAA